MALAACVSMCSGTDVVPSSPDRRCVTYDALIVLVDIDTSLCCKKIDCIYFVQLSEVA